MRTLDYTAENSITCGQWYYVGPGETNKVRVDMRALLRDGEVLTGSPTLAVTGPTASSGAVSTTMLLINGQSCNPGEAVTLTLSGGSDGVDYSVKVTCGTSQSQTRQANCIVKVREPTPSSIT